ncbi:MAG: hypothetical protein Q4G59_12735 [Planctomycetia bacterium]|nr:hypothetical protein [Planctomycetia bacterium]
MRNNKEKKDAAGMPVPYRPIESYASVRKGDGVWHPSLGQGTVAAKTQSYLFITFQSTSRIGRVSKADVLSYMGTLS